MKPKRLLCVLCLLPAVPCGAVQAGPASAPTRPATRPAETRYTLQPREKQVLEELKARIAKGEKINPPDPSGNTELHLAARKDSRPSPSC